MDWMKIPNLSCKIEMFCTVNPSESIKKIEQSISNIFPYAIINNNDVSINAHSNELRSFEKIYQFIHNNKLQKKLFTFTRRSFTRWHNMVLS